MSSATKSAQVYFYPRLLLQRLANIYADKYFNEGKDAARNWAMSFLPNDWIKMCNPHMKKALEAKGLKVKPDNPEPDKPDGAA